MKIGEKILLLFIIAMGFLLITCTMRFIVYTVAFRGQSKSSKKKAIRAHLGFWQKLSMRYVLQYNNHGLTLWTLIWYYIFFLCGVIFFLSYFFSMLNAGFIPDLLLMVVSKILLLAPLLSIFSLVFLPKKKNRRST